MVVEGVCGEGKVKKRRRRKMKEINSGLSIYHSGQTKGGASSVEFRITGTAFGFDSSS